MPEQTHARGVGYLSAPHCALRALAGALAERAQQVLLVVEQGLGEAFDGAVHLCWLIELGAAVPGGAPWEQAQLPVLTQHPGRASPVEVDARDLVGDLGGQRRDRPDLVAQPAGDDLVGVQHENPAPFRPFQARVPGHVEVTLVGTDQIAVLGENKGAVSAQQVKGPVAAAAIERDHLARPTDAFEALAKARSRVARQHHDGDVWGGRHSRVGIVGHGVTAWSDNCIVLSGLHLVDWRHLLHMKTFALLSACAVLSAGFVRATPLLEASDESRHFAMALLLKETRTLPRASVTTRTIAQQEVAQPPLYYALCAIVLGAFDTSEAGNYLAMTPGFVAGRADLSGPRNMFTPRGRLEVRNTQVETAIIVLRLLSVALGLGVILLTSLSFREFMPEAPEQSQVAASLIAFNPMFLFIHSSINNDCLLNFIAAGVVYGVVKSARRPFSSSWAAMLGFVLGLAALTKLSGLVLVPPVLLYIFLRRDSLRGAAARAGALLLVLATVASWWFVRNYFLYGSFTAGGIHTELAGNSRGAVVPLALLFEWDGFVKSYWGVFGGFNIIYSDIVYDVFYAMSLLFVVLAGWGLIGRIRARSFAVRVFFASLFATNVAGVMYWTSFLLGSQGRLLFPSIGALSLLAVSGTARLPALWRGGVWWPSVCFLLGCSGWAAFSLIPRSYLP